MIISFFESIKYLGHLWPVCILRIWTGFYFLNAGLGKWSGQFLSEPKLLAIVNSWIENPAMAQGYRGFLEHWVIPHWQVFSYAVVIGEIAVGVSFILGFMVRPAALGGLLMNINFLFAAGMSSAAINKVFIVIHLTLFLLSAGRCLGIDYYFYKRVRGFWW